jgi:hypothetical protein
MESKQLIVLLNSDHMSSYNYSSPALVWVLIIIEQSHPTDLAIHLIFLLSAINKMQRIELQQLQGNAKSILQPV